MKYNFDTIINRHGTNSLKYDFATRRGMPSGLMPMWVADMDFTAPKELVDAVTERAKHGIYGYSEPFDSYEETLNNWQLTRFGYKTEKAWRVNTPGIVFALAAGIRTATEEGDAVLIQQPVYYPFRGMILANKRKLINSPLTLSEKTGRYELDLVDFERKIVDNKVKLFILCSPHNPVGRVWTRDELTSMADICLKHGVKIMADEIHADFVYRESGKRHISFLVLDKRYLDNCIVCTSPGKTFNMAGLQFSDIFIPNATLRAKFLADMERSGYSQLNIFGIVAADSAYKHGAQWLDALLAYLYQNAQFIDRFLKENLPKVKLIMPEGTYLAWLDFRAYNLTQADLAKKCVNEAKLWLDDGTIFGPAGEGFMRLNFGCPRATVETALKNLAKAFK